MSRKPSADESNHGRSAVGAHTDQVTRRAHAEAQLAAGYPHISKELHAEHTPVNFLRITMGRNGNYYATLGVWDTADSPLVMFGSGFTVMDALWALEQALTKGSWKEDLWEKEKLVGTSGGK